MKLLSLAIAYIAMINLVPVLGAVSPKNDLEGMVCCCVSCPVTDVALQLKQ